MAEGERVQVTIKRAGDGTDFSISEIVGPGKRRGGL
jgi:hypothetical protein